MKTKPAIPTALVMLAVILTSCSPRINLTPTSTSTEPIQPTLPPEPVVAMPGVDGEIAFASDRDSSWQVLVMNADGSNETSLTAAFGAFSYPTWSPDGQRLAMRVETNLGNGSGIAVMDLQQSGTILAGSQPSTITTVFSDSPSWSPDGSQLIYISSSDFGWEFYRYELGMGAATLITGPSPWARDPKWSPDGQKILFSDDPENNGNSDIFIINPDGSGLTRLTNSENFEGNPNWSPDGNRFVFTSNANENSDLYIMNLDGSGLTRLTNDPASELDAAWSPDGTRIAFVSTRNENNDGNYEIYVINADGTAEMRLTNNLFTDRWPTWRPGSTATGQRECQSQGSFVADVTIPTGTRFVKPTSFNKVWRLQNTGQCTWTPDAFRLRFSGGEQMDAPMSIPMPGAIQPGSFVDISTRLTSPPDPGMHANQWQLLDASGNPVPDAFGNALNMAVSIEVLEAAQPVLPGLLYFLSGEKNAGQIWRMDLDGVILKQLTQEPAGISSFEVDPIDSRLAFTSDHQLILLDPTTNDRKVLVTGDADQAPGNAVFSPDGSFLAYALQGIHIYNLATGEDRLVIADNPTMDPGGHSRYTPRSWSPDGTKLFITIGYWEWFGSGIISITDGSLLSEFEFADTHSWSSDSQTCFMARASEPGMQTSTPGLFSIAAVPGASLQTLIPETFTWSPHMGNDGRLVFLQGVPNPVNSRQYMLSLMGASQEDIGQWQILRENILDLQVSGFSEATWSEDGQFLAAGLYHLPSQVSEVILISLAEFPPLYLMEAGSNLRFGR
jgi:Tol biopolymer transport system component